MQADFNRMSVRTDEEMRTARLARGLRAVAATMIVGGSVIAALDTDPTTEREIQPALERIERSMEHPG
jgi:hypothetical protein